MYLSLCFLQREYFHYIRYFIINYDENVKMQMLDKTSARKVTFDKLLSCMDIQILYCTGQCLIMIIVCVDLKEEVRQHDRLIIDIVA